MKFLKIFIKLKYGKNLIKLITDNCSINLVLYRHITTIPVQIENLNSKNSTIKFVRILYVICKDDNTDGEFKSSNLGENKYKNALNLISFNIELLQTFLSEIIYKQYKTRKTFKLRTDFKNETFDENLLPCEIYRTNLNREEALSMNSNQLFIHLAKEIQNNDQLYDKNCKYIALLSFTQYNYTFNKELFKNVKGYCALGAEWLGN